MPDLLLRDCRIESGHDRVDIVVLDGTGQITLAALTGFSDPWRCTLVGRFERMDALGADLEQKFRTLTGEAFSGCYARDVIELAWSLDTLHDAAILIRATMPGYTAASAAR